MRYEWWSMFNQTGLLLREGLLSIEMLTKVIGGTQGALWHWDKIGDIIKRQREVYNLLDLFVDFEFYASEIGRYQRRKGYSTDIPENYDSYSPDT